MSVETLAGQVIHSMVAKVTHLRPKRHNTICEALQLALDLPLELRPETRDDLAEALGRFAPPEAWPYVMLSPDAIRTVLKAINCGPKPAITLRVWTAAVSYVKYDTGEIMAGRDRLAQDADTTPQETSRALSRLVEIGALVPVKRGRYSVNPHVGWAGALSKRQEAAKGNKPVQLTLIQTP